jgi:hypothetical protein
MWNIVGESVFVFSTHFLVEAIKVFFVRLDEG